MVGKHTTGTSATGLTRHRSKSIDMKTASAARNPTSAEIKALRETSGLSQTAAASLLHTTCRTWQQWEAGDRRMHPAFWELFNIKSKKRRKP